MRLIDADALEYVRVFLSIAITTKADIDAAPTVCCEECALEPCGTHVYAPHVLLCRDFKRRTP